MRENAPQKTAVTLAPSARVVFSSDETANAVKYVPKQYSIPTYRNRNRENNRTTDLRVKQS